MGGLKVLPEITVDEFNMESKDLLILPGKHLVIYES